jgi:hypothetical protein
MEMPLKIRKEQIFQNGTEEIWKEPDGAKTEKVDFKGKYENTVC